MGGQLGAAITAAKEHEAAGYDGFWTAETSHDPFLPLLLAAEHTEHIELGTSIAVGFARSPMTLANTAYDLQAYSGRFILGLGSQIKPHITKRFSMEWSKPAARMREMILAIRAIWDCWNNDTKLEFRGEFYTHTLMTPFFNPGPNPNGDPKIFLAGVGPLMTEVAGEVADGFICHGFTTERFLREVTIPALEKGRTKAGKTMEGFEIVGPSFVVTGNDKQRDRQGGDGHEATDLLLWIDSRLPAGARPPRLGWHAGGSEQAVEAGRVAEDGVPDRRRDPQHLRRRRRAGGHRPRTASPLRRCGPADQFLCPIQGRPGPLAYRHGSVEGRLMARLAVPIGHTR